MKQLFLVWFAPITITFYWLSGFVKRRNNRWIFGSYSNAFIDNSKHLYIHVVENYPEVEAIWITNNPKVRDSICAAGGNAFIRWSWRGVIACLTGKYWFYSAYVSDVNYYCSRKATLVNLWHGIPLKKIEFDIENGPLAKLFQDPGFVTRYIYKPSVFRQPDYIVSTSEKSSRECFINAFRVEPQQCINFGYPRNDIFFKRSAERLRIIKRWDTPETLALIEKIEKFGRCLIYMPTWRDNDASFVASSGWDFKVVNNALKQHDVLLLLKLHVNTPQSVLQNAVNLSHIHIMKSTEDVYNVLPMTSGLITDYSSIMFDYLLLDKPIYYYPFDRKSYESDSRGFYKAYESCVAGRIIKSPMELSDPCIWEDSLTFADSRRKLREQLFAHVDSYASERIVQRFR